MKPRLIYIASSYTVGDVAANVAKQIEAAHLIMDLGHAPIAPLLSHFLHLHRQRPYQDWLNVDFVIVPRCDAVVQLAGESKGADQEVHLARAHNIPVMMGLTELVEWLRKVRYPLPPRKNPTLVQGQPLAAYMAHDHLESDNRAEIGRL